LLYLHKLLQKPATARVGLDLLVEFCELT